MGVKISGFAPRVAALESVLYMIIDRIKDVPKPPDAEARKEAAQVGEREPVKQEPVRVTYANITVSRHIFCCRL